MPSTTNNPDPADTSPRVALSAAFLALRERSRVLLRERSDQLRDLETRLQEQVAQCLAEASTTASQQQAAPSPSGASQQQVAALEAEVRQLRQLQRDSEKALDEARVMLVEMEDERRALCERLDAAAEVTRSPSPGTDNREEIDRLQRRLEMATQEIRELKQQMQQQEARPAPSSSARAAPSRAAAPDSQSFDWETRKKMLLQELETDFDGSQPAQAKEKLRLEDVIRETDRIIAEKDRELEELRQLLEANASDSATTKTDNVAREQLLDADEIIAAERAKLLQLQHDWQEKLRKTEVEISIERAKIARERLQLEEKVRAIQVHSDQIEDDARKSDDSKSGNPPRGRWLNRLGLGGTE